MLHIPRLTIRVPNACCVTTLHALPHPQQRPTPRHSSPRLAPFRAPLSLSIHSPHSLGVNIMSLALLLLVCPLPFVLVQPCLAGAITLEGPCPDLPVWAPTPSPPCPPARHGPPACTCTWDPAGGPRTAECEARGRGVRGAAADAGCTAGERTDRGAMPALLLGLWL